VYEYFKSLTAFAVFLSIGGLGLAVMVMSRLFGLGDHEFEHEVAADHELGADTEYGGPGFFSVRIISVLVTVFGFAGAIAIELGASIWASSLIGFGSGLLVALGVLAIARFLYQNQASSILTEAELLGQNGTVVVSISPEGVGKVRFVIGGVSIEKLAKSTRNVLIHENATVRVKGLAGNYVIVE